MENKKVKVKLYTANKKFKFIEVDECDVEKIHKVNQITWAEADKEKREKRIKG